MLSFFGQGFALGLLLAIQVGPIALLCLDRSLHGGFRRGFAVALGASLADATYALIALFSLAALGVWAQLVALPVQIGGGLLLLWLAWGAWRSRTKLRTAADVAAETSFLGEVLTIMALTLSNPLTILYFGGLFSSLGGMEAGLSDRLALAAGLVSSTFGSLLAIVLAAGWLRPRLSPPRLALLNALAALGLTGFGLWTLAEAAQTLTAY